MMLLLIWSPLPVPLIKLEERERWWSRFLHIPAATFVFPLPPLPSVRRTESELTWRGCLGTGQLEGMEGNSGCELFHLTLDNFHSAAHCNQAATYIHMVQVLAALVGLGVAS